MYIGHGPSMPQVPLSGRGRGRRSPPVRRDRGERTAAVGTSTASPRMRHPPMPGAREGEDDLGQGQRLLVARQIARGGLQVDGGDPSGHLADVGASEARGPGLLVGVGPGEPRGPHLGFAGTSRNTGSRRPSEMR